MLTSVKGKSSAPVDVQVVETEGLYLNSPGTKFTTKKTSSVLLPFLRAGDITLISMDRVNLWIFLYR